MGAMIIYAMGDSQQAATLAMMVEMKKQIDKDIIADIAGLREKLQAEIAEVRREVQAVKSQNVALKAELVKLRAEMQGVRADRQIVTSSAPRDLVAVKRDIQAEVQRNVLAVVVPQMEKVVSWVAYKTEDEGEVLNSYRRGVEKGVGATGRAISGNNDNVRLFFDDDGF